MDNPKEIRPEPESEMLTDLELDKVTGGASINYLKGILRTRETTEKLAEDHDIKS